MFVLLICAERLEQIRALQTQNMTSPQLKTHCHSLLRSLFTVGVLCKFVDFDTIMTCQSGVNPYNYLDNISKYSVQTLFCMCHIKGNKICYRFCKFLSQKLLHIMSSNVWLILESSSNAQSADLFPTYLALARARVRVRARVGAMGLELVGAIMLGVIG